MINFLNFSNPYFQPTASKKEKLPLMTRIKNEAIHYYHGFRLFFLELRISNRYLWRLFRGETLTRRERQQLVRSVTDLFRVIPFVVFIVVPFMDFLIPFYIKFFPGALPSTFEGASEKVR
jgi:LETM1 and EF-hand domain-containing protein 1, mitochondrial